MYHVAVGKEDKTVRLVERGCQRVYLQRRITSSKSQDCRRKARTTTSPSPHSHLYKELDSLFSH